VRSLAVAVVVVIAAAACHTTGHATDVVAMSSAPSSGGAREPRVSAMGSDLSDLPQLYPDGEWLPIDAPLLSMAVVVKVSVNGRSADATLDTGAMGTTMSMPVAERLGIVDDDDNRVKGKAIRAIDAHGNVVMGEKLSFSELTIGKHRWVDVDVTVLGDAPDLFLVGADVLQGVDMYIAADEGLVGLFEPGRGPVEGSDRVVHLDRSDRQLQVKATAKGMRNGVQFPLIVDTGAWNTSVPLLVGINGGLPADVGYESTTVAVGGEQTNRGRFVLDPMLLGGDMTSVGKVLAIGSTLDTDGGMGLLGNDVMMRQHTLLSFRRAEMRLKAVPQRPTTRSRGPGGAACTTSDGERAPCVTVDIVPKNDDRFEDSDLPNACLKIDVDRAFTGKTIELAITGASNELMNGGAIRAFMTANDDGAHACFHLWRQLDHLGITPDTPLSLRWVRTENVQWPCDPMKTRCITFTGPLAKLPVK
jgi:hypothetical protein